MAWWKEKTEHRVKWPGRCEHRTPRRFWAEAVNNAWYVSNKIFL
jgi:hypothetical protein